MALQHGVWKTPSYSQGNGNCVEVMLVDGGVDVRDSKDPDGHVLHYTDAEWFAFMHGTKNGEFDL